MKSMKQIIFILLSFFLATISTAQHAPSGEKVAGSSLNSTQWLEDINFIQKEILRLHPDPFYKNKDLSILF